MKKILDSILKVIPAISMAGIVVGGILGYIYYVKIGCMSGTCPIKSNPYLTIIYGALLGYLVFDMFARKKKKSIPDNPESRS